jgi:hypothetical protein
MINGLFKKVALLIATVCLFLNINANAMDKARLDEVTLQLIGSERPVFRDKDTDAAAVEASKHKGYVIQWKEDKVGVIYKTGKDKTSDCKIVLSPSYRGKGIGPNAEVHFIRESKEPVGFGIGFDNSTSILALAKAMEIGNLSAVNQDGSGSVTAGDLRNYQNSGKFSNGVYVYVSVTQ